MGSVDSFKAKGTLEVGGESYEIYRLAQVEGHDTLPYSLKVLLENLLRTEDGANITAEHIRALGGWDADARTWSGIRQYARTDPGADGFAAGLWVYRANHGQFNTTWGAYDVSIGLGKRLINTRALMDADTQRRVLEVYLSAFLDCTLGDVREYRQLFRDARAGAAWLPKTVYVTEYADATFQQLATFDEDIDLTTGTLELARRSHSG